MLQERDQESLKKLREAADLSKISLQEQRELTDRVARDRNENIVERWKS